MSRYDFTGTKIDKNNNNETTTADVYNKKYLKEIGDSDEEED